MRVTMHTRSSENFCNSAITRARFSSQNATESGALPTNGIYLVTRYRNFAGLALSGPTVATQYSQHSPTPPIARLGGGHPGTGKGRERKRGMKLEWRERGERKEKGEKGTRFHASTFPHFQPYLLQAYNRRSVI